MNIDYNLGVMKKTHPTLGVDVYMYMSEQGIYLNAFGAPVSDELAAGAGYDLVALAKIKRKRELMAQAKIAIEEQIEGIEGDPDEPSKVVQELNGFQIVDIRLGRFNVLDPEGNALNAKPLTLEQAKLLLPQIAGAVPESPPDDALKSVSHGLVGKQSPFKAAVVNPK